MRSLKQRFMALFLVMALCIGTAPFSVLAASFDAGTVTEETEDSVVSDGGVISSPKTSTPENTPDLSGGTVLDTDDTQEPVISLPDAQENELKQEDQPENTEQSPYLLPIEQQEGVTITRIQDSGPAFRAANQTGILYTLYTSSFPGGAPGNTDSFGNLTVTVSHMMLTGGVYKAAYCLDHALGYVSGGSHTTAGTTMDDINGLKRETIGFILSQGFQWSSMDYWSPSDNDKWLVTQLLIWAVMNGKITIDTKTHLITIPDSVRADIVKISPRVNNPSSFVAYYDSLAKKLKDARKIPSFCTYQEEPIKPDTLPAQNPNRIELQDINGSFQKKVKDSNSVLSNFTDILTKPNLLPGVTVSVSGNEASFMTELEDQFLDGKFERNVPGGSDAVIAWNYSPDPTSYQRFASVGAATTAVKGQVSVRTGTSTPPPNSELLKISEDDIVAGISFTVTGSDGSSHTFTTNAEGKADLSSLPVYEQVPVIGEDGKPMTDDEGNPITQNGDPITYTVTEQTPIRYVEPASQSFTPANGDTVLVFENRLKKWRVTVTKNDAETGSVAQGDATLAGAIYGIYKDGQLLDSYTTDSTGRFTTQYYPCGSGYTLEEISPSTGYLLNTSKVSVGLEPGDTTIEYNSTTAGVTEQVIKGRIGLTKHCDQGETGVETPEVGAEFQVYLSSSGSYENAKETERDVLTINEDGYAESKDLPYGTYTVHQTKSWDGREMITDFQVFVSEDGEIYRFILNNRIFEALITIVKKDAETGKVIPVSGIGFKVKNVDTGEFVVQHINYPTPQDITVFYTDVTGKLMMPEKLLAGHYELIEQASPYGYVLSKDPIPFVVDGTAKVITVEKSNVPQKGTISLHKQGEVFASVTAEGEDGPYTPVYNLQGLEGAKFAVIAAEDIITPDGTLRAAMGEQVATLTTDKFGNATTTPLYLGKYELKEISAPEGFILNTTSKYVELSYAGQEVDVTTVSVTMDNTRQKVQIDLRKALEEDEAYGAGGGDAWRNVLFGIYAAEDLTAADGTKIPADGLIETIGIDQSGKGVFTADLPFGKYYVKELATNNAYLLPEDNRWDVEFAYQGETKAIVYIHINNGDSIENKLKRGNVAGNKLDEDGLLLKGAVMGLFSADETNFTVETAIQTAESDLNGSFTFAYIPYGNYIVHEISAPEGFVLSDKSYPVTIAEQDQIITVDVDNEFIKGSLELTKTDSDFSGRVLPGAIFDIYADSNNNETYDDGDVKIGQLQDEEGVYTATDLRYGGYIIIETKAPEGYILDSTPHYINVDEDGEIIKLTVENDPQLGDLRIKKASEDGQVAGIKFNVSGKPYGGGTYDEDFETDENGEIYVSGLRPGEYTVSEVLDASTLKYIVEADKTVTVTYGGTAEVSFYNKLRRGSVGVIKNDPDHPDKVLTGAVFEVFVDVDFNGVYDAEIDKPYGTLEGKDGVYWLDNIPNGDYLLHEEKAPEGYKADPEYYPFTLSGDAQQIEITNTPDEEAGFVNYMMKGSVKILKVSAGNKSPLQGANFCLKNPDGEVIAEGTSNKDGIVLFEDIEYGKYTVEEISAPEGYIKSDEIFPVEINKDQQVIELTVENDTPSWFTPVTGDGRLNPIWLAGIIIVAAAVAGVSLYWLLKNKRRG